MYDVLRSAMDDVRCSVCTPCDSVFSEECVRTCAGGNTYESESERGEFEASLVQ